MSEGVAVALSAVVVVIALISHLVWRSLIRKRFAGPHGYEFLSADHGLEQIADGVLFGVRVVRYAGRFRGQQVAVEIGTSSRDGYVRVQMRYPRELPLGVRVASQSGDGYMMRLLRLREAEVGSRRFDDSFILLTRNSERMKEWLDRDLRHMLLRIGEEADGVRLNDDGLHVHVDRALPPKELAEFLQHGAAAVSYAFKRGEEILAEADRSVTISSAFTVITSESAEQVRP